MGDSIKLMSRVGRLFKRSDDKSRQSAYAESAYAGGGTQTLIDPSDDATLPADEDFSAAFGFIESLDAEIAASAAAAQAPEEEPGEYDLREATAEAADRPPLADAYGYAPEHSAADELAKAVRDHQEQRSRTGQADPNVPLVYAQVRPVEHAGTGPSPAVEPRGMMLRPWKRQSEALVQMQRGFSTLTDLMGAIRQNLETQNRRQEELVGHLSTLPKVLEMIPEANRMQTEALRVMQSQVGLQSEQQAKLGEILDRMTTVGNVQTESIEAMKDRVDSLKEHDEAISFNLNAVGAAMASVSKNSQTSAEVLGQMKDNLSTRDGELQQILQRQGTRFTTMLSVAVVLSVGAVVAVSVFGYLILTRVH